MLRGRYSSNWDMYWLKDNNRHLDGLAVAIHIRHRSYLLFVSSWKPILIYYMMMKSGRTLSRLMSSFHSVSDLIEIDLIFFSTSIVFRFDHENCSSTMVLSRCKFNPVAPSIQTFTIWMRRKIRFHNDSLLRSTNKDKTSAHQHS